MAINTTTIPAAITASQDRFGVASTANITAGSQTTGVGLTLLLIENEMMQVTGVTGNQVAVQRGQHGTSATAHGAGTAVTIGGLADFPSFTPAVTSVQPTQQRFASIGAPVASAATITPTSPIFHVTGTTATVNINLPANLVQGQFTAIADGIWTWTAAGNVAVAGTVTTAGSSVTFTYDAGTSKWYPSRLA
jgi:hypothetical protein